MRLRKCVLLLGFVACCDAEQMRIRVINSKTGRPVANQNVQIELMGGAGLRPGQPVEDSRKSDTTDRDGYATFTVAHKHPYLFVFFQQMCATKEISFPIETILSQGIVAKNYCWHKSSELEKLKPHPGELVMFFDNLNFFEQWKHIRDAPGIP